MIDLSTEQHLQSLFAEARNSDLPALAARGSPRIPYLLAARFAHDVNNGGFAQLIYNMKGDLLFEIQEMLDAAGATIACDYYVLAMQACMKDREAYHNFIDSAFTTESPLKSELHKI